MRRRIENGELFLDNCQGLVKDRQLAKERMMKYNLLFPSEFLKKEKLINEIFGKESNVFIESPFYFTYGRNIEFGKDCYVNYNCNFIDDGRIIIGNKVMFGANVTIATVGHPINPKYRRFMYTDPVVIEDNCWIGASVVINPGVRIGENSVIGSGSIVTKNIPANSVAVGNPCKVVRKINEYDLKYYRKDSLIVPEELEQIDRVNKNT